MKWQLISVTTNEINGIKTTTEAMQLPAGLLIHVVTERPAKSVFGLGAGGGLASSLAFIPHAQLNRVGLIEHRL